MEDQTENPSAGGRKMPFYFCTVAVTAGGPNNFAFDLSD